MEGGVMAWSAPERGMSLFTCIHKESHDSTLKEFGEDLWDPPTQEFRIILFPNGEIWLECVHCGEQVKLNELGTSNDE
jgi:hypothetical protein